MAKPDSMPQGVTELSMQPCKGIRVFESVAEGQPDQDSVGRPIPHVAAESMVSGEAEYVDDIPPYQSLFTKYLILNPHKFPCPIKNFSHLTAQRCLFSKFIY